ncbi:MAG: Na+/H+ antiporter NhaA [Longimicrobiales bacterium]|nr:Na+/H+ antiporter NhaA [Longimicrobiales bacterium]
MARDVRLPLQEFIQTEGVGSAMLLAAAIIALVIANSPAADAFHRLLETRISLDLAVVAISNSVHHWVSEGLMALFFLVVGLEIKRELLHGHLADRRKAALSVFAALGGMAGPALVYFALNAGGAGERGWGIPMATDIAFALGVLGLLGKGIPAQLRVFLLALAIVDDLGAILVIAFFYTEQINVGALGAGAVILAGIMLLRSVGVRSMAAYGVPAFLFWVAIQQSGIHATIAGVILAFLTPARPYYGGGTALTYGRTLLDRLERATASGDHDDIEATLGQLEELAVGTESPLERLERKLHPWTALVVLPLFALVNAGVAVSPENLMSAARSPVALGIAGGLLAGKFAGIFGTSWLAVRLGVAVLPEGVQWEHIAGASLLGGVGFTVSLFITELAFTDPGVVDTAKLAILVASLLAGAAGFLALRAVARRTAQPEIRPGSSPPRRRPAP